MNSACPAVPTAAAGLDAGGHQHVTQLIERHALQVLVGEVEPGLIDLAQFRDATGDKAGFASRADGDCGYRG